MFDVTIDRIEVNLWFGSQCKAFMLPIIQTAPPT